MSYREPILQGKIKIVEKGKSANHEGTSQPSQSNLHHIENV